MIADRQAAGWPSRLRFAVALAGTVRAHDVMLGHVSPAFERARVDVLAAIDDAERAGASEADIDAVLAELA